MDSHIRVSMFDDRVEVVSPGGLPSGITAEEYLSGKLSVYTWKIKDNKVAERYGRKRPLTTLMLGCMEISLSPNVN